MLPTKLVAIILLIRIYGEPLSREQFSGVDSGQSIQLKQSIIGQRRRPSNWIL